MTNWRNCIFAISVLFFSFQLFAGGGKPFQPPTNPIDLKPFLKNGTPVDDPNAYNVDESLEYEAKLGNPNWLIPSILLPDGVKPMKSNNNVAITFHNNRLFLGFRTGKTHFASKKVKMYIMSTKDGEVWKKEAEVAIGRDVREPQFLSLKGKLYFYFFMAGKSMVKFEPTKVYRMERIKLGEWSKAVESMEKGEVPWEMKIRNGKAYMTSYKGSHYQVFGDVKVDLMFKETTDGINFTPVNGKKSVYQGGVSECAFEFEKDGSLWAITRNEDGDETGFGSHLVSAPSDDITSWEFPKESNPKSYMSPKMFRHGKDIYLVSRRQLGRKPFGRAGRIWGMPIRRLVNWIGYSLTPKTTSIFKLDKEKREMVHVLDMPGAGDTALPSVHRLDAHRFLIANYTSRPDKKRRRWLVGQLRKTFIYLQILEFKPKKN